MTIAQNLINDETVTLEAQKHWIAPVRDSLIAALMIIGAAVLRAISPSWDGLFSFVGSLIDLISVGLFIGGIGWIVYNVFNWRTARFAVTNLRVMREEGLIKHRSSATMLTSLSDVRTNQGLLGKQLGFGDIVIYSQSGDAGVDRFRSITGPMEFRNAIMAQKTALATPAGPAPAPAAVAPVAAAVSPGSSADAAEALAKLADLRDRGAITAEEFEAKKTEILARM
jgi:membrane protein YdbS with pleckstrin-like domain